MNRVKYSAYDVVMGKICGKVNRNDSGIVLRHLRRVCAEDFDVTNMSDAEVLRQGGYALLEHTGRLMPNSRLRINDLTNLCHARIVKVNT